MTGIAGRSGKPRTPEERAAKREYARMGGNATAGRNSPPPSADGAKHSPALLAMYPELEGYPFPVTDALMLKDALENINKQAKARQAEVELDVAKTAREVARGKLVPADAVREVVRAKTEAILAEVHILIDAALALCPLERQPSARIAMDRAAEQFRVAARDAVKSK